MAAELATTDNLERSASPRPLRLLDNPIVRQLTVMLGIALSVAIGVAVVLWSQTPGYSLLYGSLSQKDAPEVMEALQQAAIEYQVDTGSGALTVPTADLAKARMQLAALGLPHADSLGFELLQQESGFGTSRAMEAARFQRAMEGELARTIGTLANVQAARVHLATPKQSVFVRQRKSPTASVVLKLYSGRSLEKDQVQAIVHLVASSVPELQPSHVTVVDQKGRLLSGDRDSGGLALSTGQFEYTRELERHFKQRIESILTPLLGRDKVRAEVTAELDFTVTEKTREQFNPDQPALRSERISEQQSRLDAVQGVPGALSNQPPAAGTAPEQTDKGAGAGDAGSQGAPGNSSRQSTRNFELDKTISHTRLAIGTLRRLSVAVVVDDRRVTDAEGKLREVPRSDEEITRIATLVREAIGYSAQRGDSVRVVNAAFELPEAMEVLPEPAFWERTWFWDLIRQGGGALLVVLLIFGVLLPTMKRLTAPPVAVDRETAGADGEEGLEGELTDQDQPAALEAQEQMQLPGPRSYESTLDAARQLVRDDPKRVAQAVRRWVAEDAG